jgi:hypothetical protein
MSTYRSLMIVLASAAVLSVAACGSSGSGGETQPHPSTSVPASTSSAPAASSSSASAAGGSGASKTIAANWTAFFNAKTPEARRVALLQDGSTFASVIKSQLGSGLAAEATAKVTKVTVTSATQASVVYDIQIDGQTALPNAKGVAVKQGGTWKVGVASLCGLLKLESGGKTSGLPAACQSAS